MIDFCLFRYVLLAPLLYVCFADQRLSSVVFNGILVILASRFLLYAKRRSMTDDLVTTPTNSSLHECSVDIDEHTTRKLHVVSFEIIVVHFTFSLV